MIIEQKSPTNQPNLVDLLESILSEAGKPRLDLNQANRLSEELWPKGLDSLLDTKGLSEQRSRLKALTRAVKLPRRPRMPPEA